MCIIMKPPCEILVSKILPQVRALVTIELADTWEMRGRDIARLVGITEAAVSHYINRIRGVQEDFLTDFPELGPFVIEASRELYDKRDTDFELTEKLGDLCTLLRNNKTFIDMYAQGSKGASCGICYKEVP